VLKVDDDCSVDSLISIAAVEEARFAAATQLSSVANIEYAPGDGLTAAAPRLKEDIAALIKLSNFELPPLRVARPSRVVHVYYGFGDASGKQFRATISDDYNCKSTLSPERQDIHGVRFRIGLWSATKEGESSNYKELCNLVQTISAEAN